jgi:hypothetical protein
MLITDHYRAENIRQHTESTGYGERGYKHLPDVLAFAQRIDAKSVLDYGCGKGSLATHARRVSPLPFTNYDPAIPMYAAEPAPADLVVCTDVLEHIEPLCLQDVLQHLASLGLKGFYFQIACRPAKRVLSDGRNAHLLVREPYFWLDNVRHHFDITDFRALPGHSVVIAGHAYGSAYK